MFHVQVHRYDRQEKQYSRQSIGLKDIESISIGKWKIVMRFVIDEFDLE